MHADYNAQVCYIILHVFIQIITKTIKGWGVSYIRGAVFQILITEGKKEVISYGSGCVNSIFEMQHFQTRDNGIYQLINFIYTHCIYFVFTHCICIQLAYAFALYHKI